MWLSAIIPTYREACRIADAVAAARAVADEVIVVDSGSDDGTAEIAVRVGAKLVHAPRGRGVQLGTGATAARGEVLLFLHADARLGAGARFAIHRALSDPRAVGGNFRLRFDSGTPAAWLLSAANDLRRRWLRIYIMHFEGRLRIGHAAALGRLCGLSAPLCPGGATQPRSGLHLPTPFSAGPGGQK